MSVTPLSSRVSILVKALPQPSKTHGETVCCAGVTAEGDWKRLFPIRFRHLGGDSSFKRWDWVEFNYSRPNRDSRMESCRVHEESIRVTGSLKRSERVKFLESLIDPSIKSAEAAGKSLALIRPKNPRFRVRPKSQSKIQEEREAYKLSAAQTSMFDKELAALEPTPYEFRFKFEDEHASHDFANGDWEAHAMYWRGKSEGSNDRETLDWIMKTFGSDYPSRGMLFAVGNQAKRPQTWQLLGVLRVDETDQPPLPL